MDNKRYLRMHIARIMSVFALFFMSTASGLAFDDNPGQKTISGIVTDIDWVKSIITVRYSDPFSGNADEVDIIVPSDTRIMNGTETEYLSDIEQSDAVTVTYYDDGVSGLKAKRIADLNQGNQDS